MAKAAEIDSTFLTEFLLSLLNIPSPTGRTEPALAHVETALTGLGLACRRTRKGGLLAEWPGRLSEAPRGLTAHVDTLGAMVKEIKPSGRLRLTEIGSFAWNTVEGEGCTVFTRSGRVLRGALLATKASGHVFGKEVRELKREAANMEVRLDERTHSAETTRALGLEVGDFVAFDPRPELSASGFIRSRHLDDKSGVACLVAAVKAMRNAGLVPAQQTFLYFSHYEEVGHGAAAAFPAEVVEMVAVDMAPVGEGQASDEFHATLCLKDSGGPYHAGLSECLRALAETAGIPFRVDTYPFYGSDAEAAWQAGADLRAALIGPGVDASHNYERTHCEALIATARWIVEYLLAG